ncbi:MAG: class E sortase [Candidatus Roizmanbacteria bacterium]|nr:MAG: class E sortase [Candidatus Roizmanbacteria bacterium]
MQIPSQLKKKRTGEYFKILILRTIGNFLIFSSLFMVGKTFYQPVREEVRYFVDKTTNKKYVVADLKLLPTPTIQPGRLSKTFKKSNIEVLTPEDPNFGIIIPEIGANARVISNVDASDEREYLQALQKGVSHAQGTAFPGEGGHIFLFAHSTDYLWNVGTYNAIFYLLYKLKAEDEIDIFYKGQRYVYKIIDRKIVDPSQVEYLTRKTNKEFLTLQTCWPPGTALKRLLVFAERVVE